MRATQSAVSFIGNSENPESHKIFYTIRAIYTDFPSCIVLSSQVKSRTQS